MPAPSLMPHDLKYLGRLAEGINNSDKALMEAQASMGRAAIGQQAARASMDQFMAHISEIYGLKPQDIIDQAGTIHLVDPGWAMEAAVAEQEKAAMAAQLPQEEIPEPPAVLPEPIPEPPAEPIPAPIPIQVRGARRPRAL